MKRKIAFLLVFSMLFSLCVPFVSFTVAAERENNTFEFTFFDAWWSDLFNDLWTETDSTGLGIFGDNEVNARTLTVNGVTATGILVGSGFWTSSQAWTEGLIISDDDWTQILPGAYVSAVTFKMEEPIVAWTVKTKNNGAADIFVHKNPLDYTGKTALESGIFGNVTPVTPGDHPGGVYDSKSGTVNAADECFYLTILSKSGGKSLSSISITVGEGDDNGGGGEPGTPVRYTFVDADGYMTGNNFGKWIKFEGDFNDIGIFGDWVRPAWGADANVVSRDAFTSAEPDGYEVTRVLAGKFDTSNIASGIYTTWLTQTTEIKGGYGGAVTYIFPYPIVSWKVNAHLNLTGKVFLSEGPVDYTAPLPDDYQPQTNMNWVPSISGTVAEGEKYYCLTVLFDSSSRAFMGGVEAVIENPNGVIPIDPMKYGDVPEVSAAPVLGDFNKTIYEQGLKLDIDKYHPGGVAVSENQGGSIWLLRSGDDLYVYGELKHINDAWVPSGSADPWCGTNIELYLSFDYGKSNVNSQYRISTWHPQTINFINTIPGIAVADLYGENALPYLETAKNFDLNSNTFYVEYRIHLLPVIKDNKIGLNVQYQESTPADEWGTNMVLDLPGGFKASQNYKYINLAGYDVPQTMCMCTAFCEVCGGCAEPDCCKAYYCDCTPCPNGGFCLGDCNCERCPICENGCLEVVCCGADGCETCEPCEHAYTASGRFAPTDELLNNPHVGIETFQKVNGSATNPADWGFWGVGSNGTLTQWFDEIYSNWDGNLANANYPDTSVAYWRFYWKDLEPAKGNYIWDEIDRLLEIANERGQTVMTCLMCYGSEYGDDVPQWFKDEYAAAGGVGYWNGYDNGWNDGVRNTGIWWMADNNHPLFVEYFTAMVKSFAERFDGDPRLDSIDFSFSGYWGEGMATEQISTENIYKFCDAYLDNFKHTPLIPMDGSDHRTHTYIRNKGVELGLNIGWRANSFGDLGYSGPSFAHMYHAYPQDLAYVNNIIPGRPVWTDGPISFESAFQMRNWVPANPVTNPNAGLHYDWDVEWIFNKGLEWHISTWNDKSGRTPDNYAAMVDEFIKRMGYRFSIAGVDYFDKLEQGGTLNIRTLWSNLGVAPLYHEGYALAYRLTNGTNSYMLYSDTNLREWMPSREIVTLNTPWRAVGDIKVYDSFKLPSDMPAGDYDIQIAIVDIGRFVTNAPAIKLANGARDEDGWHTVGSVNINECGGPVVETDAEFLAARASGILKNGLSPIINLILDGKILTLVIDGREFILSENANNRNIDGEINLGNGWYLRFDIKGNGSNVKEFKIFRK